MIMKDDDDKVSDLTAMDESYTTQPNSINSGVSGRSNHRLHNIATRATHTKKKVSVESKRQKNGIKELSRKIKSVFSPDRDKIKATSCDEILKDEEVIEFYLAPTNLHKACHSASSFEDFRDQITSSYTSDKAITEDIQKKDVNGRNPFHLLALNKKLASSIAKEEQEEDYTDSYANLDISKAAKISDFILKYLLPKYPLLLLDNDNNGFLPFEEIISFWIKSVQNFDLQPPLVKPTQPDRLFGKVPYREIEKVQSTLLSKSSSNNSDSERLYTSNPSSLFSLLEKRSQESPSLDNDRTCSPKNLDQISEPHHKCSTDVPPTLQLKYVLYLLSAVIDYLGIEEIVENGEVERTQSRRSLLSSRASSAYSIDGSCHLHEIHTPMKTSIHGCEGDLDGIESLYDIRSNLLSKFASISEIIKTLLLISDMSEKDIIFQYSAVRGIMLQRESVGDWLPSMLQSPRRKVANQAVEYLQLLSDVLKEETQTSEHVHSKETDKKVKELYDELRYLDDLIPSMLALDQKMLEKVATTPVISRVLDRIITAPFAACLIFFDVVILAMLIFTFQKSTTKFLVGDPPEDIITWIYVVSCFTFYFVIKELGKGVALQAVTTRRLFWNHIFYNVWTIIDILSILMTVASTITMRLIMANWEHKDSSPKARTLLAITIALLWLKFLGILKTVNKKLATFTLALAEITRDIIWYIIIIVMFWLTFAQVNS